MFKILKTCCNTLISCENLERFDLRANRVSILVDILLHIFFICVTTIDRLFRPWLVCSIRAVTFCSWNFEDNLRALLAFSEILFQYFEAKYSKSFLLPKQIQGRIARVISPARGWPV